MFAHAVHEYVRTAVNEHRWAHSVVPVVIVGETAQRSLKTADSYWYVAEVLSQLLTVDDNSSVRAFACNAACGLCVIGTLALCGGIVSHHRVDISCGNEESVFRSTKAAEVLVRMPVGL